jgi:hypothetical protein
MKYICGDRIFYTLDEAKQYADFIHRISRIILGIEEVRA